MTRTVEQNRVLLRKKARWIRDQAHFDQVMEVFPPEMRQEIYDEVKPLLGASLQLKSSKLETA